MVVDGFVDNNVCFETTFGIPSQVLPEEYWDGILIVPIVVVVWRPDRLK